MWTACVTHIFFKEGRGDFLEGNSMKVVKEARCRDE